MFGATRAAQEVEVRETVLSLDRLDHCQILYVHFEKKKKRPKVQKRKRQETRRTHLDFASKVELDADLMDIWIFGYDPTPVKHRLVQEWQGEVKRFIFQDLPYALHPRVLD